MLWVSDALPDGSGFLLSIHEPTESGYDLLVDGRGEPQFDFRTCDSLDPYLARTSVAPDGRYLAAFRSHDDGHMIAGSDLFLVSPRCEWCVPIESAPAGLWPRLSREGHAIAFEGLDGQLHIGRLAVSGL
jgi:hypothetical protein